MIAFVGMLLVVPEPANWGMGRQAAAQATAPPIVLTGQSNADFLKPHLQAVYPGPVVCVARGSTSIALWAPTGTLWLSLRAAMRQDASALVWWQGESDPRRPTYRAELESLVARVRSELGRASLPVIVIRAVRDPSLARVRIAQGEFVDNDLAAVLVNVDDLKRESPSSYHLTADGYAVVALRVLNALSRSVTPSPR